MAFPTYTQFSRALQDFREGLGSVHIWPMLGWQEIRQRYRRSFLGPFWLTLSTALLVAAMGPIYGQLMGQGTAGYVEYIAIGIVLWQFISSLINEGCQTFIAAEGFLKQTRIPLTVYALGVVWRSLIVLAHNFVIVIAIVGYLSAQFSWQLLFVPLGVLAIAVNGLWLCLLLGSLSARFRDIPQMVASVMQILMFITPIMWRPDMLASGTWVAQWNPLYHFIEIVRAPLLGEATPILSWLAVAAVTGAGALVTLIFFARYRARVAFWV
jgi:ABC-type polysaccharide/polyol phosphate export permease